MSHPAEGHTFPTDKAAKAKPAAQTGSKRGERLELPIYLMISMGNGGAEVRQMKIKSIEKQLYNGKIVCKLCSKMCSDLAVRVNRTLHPLHAVRGIGLFGEWGSLTADRFAQQDLVLRKATIYFRVTSPSRRGKSQTRSNNQNGLADGDAPKARRASWMMSMSIISLSPVLGFSHSRLSGP